MKIMKQSPTKRLFLPAVALCSLLLSGNAAHAALVTYSFTGRRKHHQRGIAIAHDEPDLSCDGVVSI